MGLGYHHTSDAPFSVACHRYAHPAQSPVALFEPSTMSLLAFGINHKTAPVAIRERVAFTPDRVDYALHQLASHSAIQEAAILSTCNRTEIYLGMDRPETDEVLGWLADFHQLPNRDLLPYTYAHPDQVAVRHILRVASGLDSLILGEPQILGQMKAAYTVARDAGTISTRLDRLFQHTFAVAKQVRTDTAIGSSPVSVAFAAVGLARQIFSTLTARTALLIGAGETIELAARHLRQNGIGRIIVANRTLERAHLLATELGGYAIALHEIENHLAEADIVISSTASPQPILTKSTVEAAIKIRRHRPIFMVDIAVPRDIESEVGKLADVYLYTVDDLTEVIQENLRSRQEAAKQAEEIIDVQVAAFMGWIQSLDAVSTICAYRAHAESLRDLELERAQRMLAAGRDPAEVLRLLARGLTNKFLHRPCTQLRQAAYEGRTEILSIAQELFDLGE
ncbi:glutamyl-tRNA reductase [Gammaproteobacteria bacterium]